MSLFPYLLEVDDGLPEVVLLLVEVSHTHFTEVTGMVLVHVRAVVVLTTGKTTTTRMLPGLANTTVTGRDVAATEEEELACRSCRCARVQCRTGCAVRNFAMGAWLVYVDVLLAGLSESGRHCEGA